MAAKEFELEASVRTASGKAESRRMRRLRGTVPAVLYGGGGDPVSLSIAHKDIARATENEAFFSHVVTLNIGGRKEQTVIKALQRHPSRPFILHADFQRVRMDRPIQVKVPIHFLNEDRCVGVKAGGGNILKTLNEIEVLCLPKDLPEYIEVDMLEVDVGESVHLSDVALPEGVASVALSHGGESDLSVAIVQAKRGGADEEDGEAAAEDAADGAEGTAADGEPAGGGDKESGGGGS